MDAERSQQNTPDIAGQIRFCGLRVFAALAVLAFAALISGPVAAQSDAFSVEVAVADRSPEERQGAYVQALRRVLVSNSGDKTVMNRDEIRAALAAAEDYVETYRFRTPEPGTLIPADTLVSEQVRESGEATDLLLVRFNRESVLTLIAGGRSDREVDNAAVGVSPLDNVDRALVWLLIEDTERTVRGTDPAASKVRERLREIAGGGGIALVFPEVQADSDPLDDDVLRSQNVPAVRAASVRYAIDVVLTGHLTRAVQPALDVPQDPTAATSRVRRQSSPGRAPRTDSREAAAGWVGNWTRSAGDVSETTRTSGTSLDDVLRAGISWLVSDVSVGLPASYEYGGTGSSAEGLVRIDGLNAIDDYAELSRLLAGVPGVANSWPRELSGDSAIFSVVPRNALGAVSVALDGVDWLRRGVLSSDAERGAIDRGIGLVYDVIR